MVDQWLEHDQRMPRKQRHTAQRTCDRLTNEHGYTGSYSPVQRYVKQWKKDHKAPEVTPADDNTLAIVLGTLVGLAGLGLVIAGINYWVNKDGNLVTDPNHVNEPSTSADAANTQKIVGENVDEVASLLGIDPATGQPVNGERGIAASTGVNKVPAALLSLLIASILGTAVFASAAASWSKYEAHAKHHTPSGSFRSGCVSPKPLGGPAHFTPLRANIFHV